MFKSKKVVQSATYLGLLPLLTGCGGGLAALGSLFGGRAAGGGEVASAILPAGGEAAIVALHNPEPASMLLMGSGAVAMAFMKRRKNSK